MSTITVQDVQSDPLGWLHRVEAGETLLVTRGDRAIAEIKPLPIVTAQRPMALCAGEFIVPDGFDDPLPEALLREFERP